MKLNTVSRLLLACLLLINACDHNRGGQTRELSPIGRMMLG